MKIKSISFILCLFSYAFLTGQTIGTSAYPNIGDEYSSVGYSVNFGLNPAGLSPGSAGANQVWDFSDVDVDESQAAYGTLAYVALDDFVYRSEFPDANMGFIASSSGAEFFFLRTSNGLTSLGFADEDVIGTYEGECNGVELPISLGDSFITSCTSNIYYNSTGSTISTTVETMYAFDASGTVHTPEGTFNNCNRILGTTTIEAGAYTFTSYSYVWYANNSLEPVATMATDDAGNVQSLSWGTDIMISSVDKTVADNYTLHYLNNGQFNLVSDVSMKTNISLVDLMGRTVEQLNDYSILEGENQFEFAMNNAAAGMYVLVVKDTKTGATQSLKFIK